MKKAEIYTISDPDTGLVRYVGKADCAKKRFVTHMRDARRRKTPVYSWINSLAARGKKPVMAVVMSTWDWQHSEREFIAQCRQDAVPLLNLSVGGDQPYCTPEQCSLNAKRINADRAADPLKMKIWEYKKTINYGLRKGWVSGAAKENLRLAAHKRPDLFGLWATI